MRKIYPLHAVLVLCLFSGSLLAGPLPDHPLYVKLTDDNRLISFFHSESGRDKLFHVALTYSEYRDPHGLKTADLALEVLDQGGKVIPITLPAGETAFTLVSTMGGGGTASVAYRMTPEAGQVPTSVNVTWRGKEQHIVLTADNYFKI